MTLLIDPPRWPAHGTEFSHLVSDASLEELHAAARAIGLSERAFDRDHYDIPRQRYAEAVAHGAVEVSGKELVRRLRASGLRIPARRRPDKVVTALRWLWDHRVLPALPPDDDGVRPDSARLGPVREQLLERWGETHRSYHDRTHLLAVLRALDELVTAGTPGSDPCHAEHPAPEVSLAAWFHDAVYAGRPGQDEEDSARLAEQLLADAGLPEPLVARTAQLVRMTADHCPAADDPAAALLSDADLAVLGGRPADYADYVQRVRREYAHVPEPDFHRGRLQVLEGLRQGAVYSTPQAAALWEAQAQENLAVEIDDLRLRLSAEAQPPQGAALLRIVGVCFVDRGRLLTVRKRGTSKFMLVGGKLEPGETPQAAGARETAEEVGRTVAADELGVLGEFLSPAANEADTWIRSTVLLAPQQPRPEAAPQAEIEQLRPLDLAPTAVEAVRHELAPLLGDQVIPLLRRRDERFWTAGAGR